MGEQSRLRLANGKEGRNYRIRRVVHGRRELRLGECEAEVVDCFSEYRWYVRQFEVSAFLN